MAMSLNLTEKSEKLEKILAIFHQRFHFLWKSQHAQSKSVAGVKGAEVETLPLQGNKRQTKCDKKRVINRFKNLFWI